MPTRKSTKTTKTKAEAKPRKSPFTIDEEISFGQIRTGDNKAVGVSLIRHENNRYVALSKMYLAKDGNLMLDDYKRHTKYLGENVFHATNASIARLLARHAEKAGLKKIRLHDFRHSHASMLIQAGVPAIAIAERLGHKNVQTTLSVYSHLYRSTKDKVISVIESL